MSTYPDFGDSPITREYLSSYTKFELLNFVMEILSKFYETSKALVNAIAERDELRQMLNGCDIAGPELMAENEKLREECVSSLAAFEAILKFQDCNYGPAWNMQKIARAQLIQAEERGALMQTKTP